MPVEPPCIALHRFTGGGAATPTAAPSMTPILFMSAVSSLLSAPLQPRVLARSPAGTMMASGAAAATAAKTAQLLTSYDATIALLEDEIAACSRGDEVFLQLYLLEGGSSSEAVLAALEEAGASRGVRVTFVLDVSYVSMLSRLTEKTTTLIPRVEQLATAQPQWCSCTYGSKPDHSKYALFLRSEPGASSAILGGMNLGDRFRDWRDFVVRLPSPYAELLQTSLGVDVASSSSAPPALAGGGSGAEQDGDDDAAAVSWTVKARAEALAITTPATAAAIFVSLGTLALAAPLATAAVAAATSPVAVSSFFYAAIVAIAGTAATLYAAAASAPRPLCIWMVWPLCELHPRQP